LWFSLLTDAKEFAMPATVRGILLDIEGTTSSISFVHDTMFPFVLERLDEFLAGQFAGDDVQSACEQIAKDAGQTSLAQWQATRPERNTSQIVAEEVRRLMASDVKATGLKALQGLIWHEGFNSGQLKSHVYPDVLPAIERWKAAGIDVRIYSSGSIAAQKLFFGHVENVGNCLHLFSGHYDTTIGGKKESQSYQRIAEDWGLPPADILFISDIAAELEAARTAGLQTLASIRPGNSPLADTGDLACITSFEQVVC
jgi:enolase-phosphatase E1